MCQAWPKDKYEKIALSAIYAECSQIVLALQLIVKLIFIIAILIFEYVKVGIKRTKSHDISN